MPKAVNASPSKYSRIFRKTVALTTEGGEPETVPGQETFPRSERLIRRKDFLDIYQRGEKQVGRGFICYVVRQEGTGRKFGVAVSRRVGGAVTRNRVKRFIREAYRTSRKHLIDHIQMVVVARPGSASMTYHECREAIGQLFHRGEVLSE